MGPVIVTSNKIGPIVGNVIPLGAQSAAVFVSKSLVLLTVKGIIEPARLTDMVTIYFFLIFDFLGLSYNSKNYK